MRTLAEMPKQVMIALTSIDIQLGLRPLFTVELCSMRTLKRKCMEVRPDHEGRITAPSGYRIDRIWKGTPSVANELPIG